MSSGDQTSETMSENAFILHFANLIQNVTATVILWDDIMSESEHEMALMQGYHHYLKLNILITYKITNINWNKKW